MVLSAMRSGGHEQVSAFRDPEAGLEAVVAVHDTARGPALGGTRLLPYDTDEAALADALRLARAMSYKAAAADLPLGGGKAVIVADPDDADEALFRAYGRAVDRLGGTYITTEDVNTHVADMDVVATETDHVVGTSDGLGDPSPVTAHGVVHGLRACLRRADGDPSLDGVSVLVQGAGKVGRPLAERLHERGADVAVSDPNQASRRALFDRVGAELPVVDPADAFDYDCDVFAPCAVGRLGLGDDGSLTDAVDRLACDIVAGSANNALGDADEALGHARRLADRGILYAPDYVVNAGGLISTYHEYRGGEKADAFADAERIEERLDDVFDRAEEADVTPLAAANELAERRLRE